MWPLLKTFSWQEITHHPWRTAVAVLAVMLGVALAYAVHLINASALAEFGSATQAVSGRPDVSLRARQGSLPDTLLPVGALTEKDHADLLKALEKPVERRYPSVDALATDLRACLGQTVQVNTEGHAWRVGFRHHPAPRPGSHYARADVHMIWEPGARR